MVIGLIIGLRITDDQQHPEQTGGAAVKRSGQVKMTTRAKKCRMFVETARQFDAVLSTVMLHHLGRKARQQCVREIRRVLKPGGRVLAVDFGGRTDGKKGLLDLFHHHGYVNLRDLNALVSEAGLNSVESGAVGIGDLQFVLAAAPCCA